MTFSNIMIIYRYMLKGQQVYQHLNCEVPCLYISTYFYILLYIYVLHFPNTLTGS